MSEVFVKVPTENALRHLLEVLEERGFLWSSGEYPTECIPSPTPVFIRLYDGNRIRFAHSNIYYDRGLKEVGYNEAIGGDVLDE